MVVVSYPRLIPRGVARKLNATYQSRFYQEMQVIVDRLGGERAEPFAGNVRDLDYVAVLSSALHGGEDGKARRGHAKSRRPKSFRDGEFIQRHVRPLPQSALR
jgi:hypothetical protein